MLNILNIQMGSVCALATMAAIFVVCWVVSRWDARMAYGLLEQSAFLGV